MKIVLMRHGKPEIDLRGCIDDKYKLCELVTILQNYEHSRLSSEQIPPTSAKQISTECNIVVCSHLPRSIQSAQLLGKTPIMSDPIFRELHTPKINWPTPQLKMIYWIYFLFAIWLLGYHKGTESIWQIRKRAEVASNKLIELAENNYSVLFIGHGVINRFIARALIRKSFRSLNIRAESYWDFVVYEKEN